MNISVNFNADVQSRYVEHRAQTNNVNAESSAQASSSLGRASPSGVDDRVDLGNNASTTKPQDFVSGVEQTKTELKVNNTDYKIKMLIDRSVGNNTIQTVLNFYKIGTNEPVESQGIGGTKDIDVLA